MKSRNRRDFLKTAGGTAAALSLSGLSSTHPRGITLDNEKIEVEDADYYITDAFTENACSYVKDACREGETPFFLYLAYTAPHWPLHAKKEDIEKYRGTYMKGWDELRRERHARMIERGVVREEWGMAPPDARPWSKLSEKKKREMDFRMAIYAAQIDRVDQNIGRLVKTLEGTGQLDNTLLLFLADNGACAEDGNLGGGRARQLGTKKEGFFLSFGRAWAHASNTPLRLYKHWVHEGGLATPLIAHWPARIRGGGKVRRQPGYLPDIMPSLLEVTGAKYPRRFHGKDIFPMEGESLIPVIEGEALERSKPMCWEHERNRAIRIGDWKLVARHKEDWELYKIREDRTEVHDLCGKQPERAREMARQWEKWAKRCHVKPRGTG